MGIRHSSEANDGDPAIRWSQRCDGGKRFDAIDAEPTDAPGSGATSFEEALALEVLRAFPGISPADLGARLRAVKEEVCKATAGTSDSPTACAPALSYGDGRESVWREINALLGEYRNVPPYSIPDRIRALVADVKRLRAKLELVESWNDQIAAILGCDPGETVSTAQRTAGDLVAARAEIARLEARSGGG